MKRGDILELYKSNNDVFSIKDLALIWKEENPNNLKSKIKSYLELEEEYTPKQKIIIFLRRLIKYILLLMSVLRQFCKRRV